MDNPTLPKPAPQYKFTHFRHRPHNTLFGSNLEQISYNQQIKIRSLDIEECEKEAQKYEAPRIRVKPSLLPPSTEAAQHVRENLMSEYELKKRRVEECEARLKQTNQKIKAMETQSRFVHPLDSLPDPSPARSIYTSDCERKPIRQEVIHKYRGKPEGAHTYALVGDLLRPGQDFGMSRPVVISDDKTTNKRVGQERNSQENLSKQMRQMITNSMPSAEHIIETSGVKIPANVHHSYGSHVVEKLLADRHQVDAALKRLDAVENKHRTRNGNKATSFVKPMLEDDAQGNDTQIPNGISYQRIPSTNYEGMGSVMRSNLFGPSSSKHQFTIESQNIHNERVLQQRDEDMPQKYGYKTDDFKKWVDVNNVQRRVMKEIEAKHQEANA